jgi:hypothetical protein
MVSTTCSFVRSTTETVPDVAAPFTGSATIGVPADQIWKSFSVAARPPSLLILGGRAIDHDAVRRVPDPDLRALRWRGLGQVDLGQGVMYALLPFLENSTSPG